MKLIFGRERLIVDHGGDLTTALAHFGFSVDDWIDLSTGINPFAYPFKDIPARSFRTLPSRDAMHKLHITARRSYRVPDGAAIMAGPGSQAILQILPTLFAPKLTQIIMPTYGEHEVAWRAAGHKIMRAEEPDPESATFMVLGNPNNPDCRIWDADRLLEYAKIFAKKGGLLIVDEAFADANPEISVVTKSDAPGILVLRSFGKFFGLPGVRLGFAIGEQAVIRRLQSHFGLWPISGPAIYLGQKALADEKWISDTRVKLKVEIERLKELLRGHGLQIAAQTDLYVLVHTGNAAALHDHLARRAIWTRSFAYNNSWLRIGLPPSDAALGRLDRALKDAPLDSFSGE